MDVNERIARVIGFQVIREAEKDAMIEDLQDKLAAACRAGFDPEAFNPVRTGPVPVPPTEAAPRSAVKP